MSVIVHRFAHSPASGSQMITFGYDGNAATGSTVVFPIASMVRPQERTPQFTCYGGTGVKVEFTQSHLNGDCLRPEQPPANQYHWRTIFTTLTVDTPTEDTSNEIPQAIRITFSGTSAISLTTAFP